MIRYVAILSFIVLSFFSQNAFAQGTTDQELARHYYQNGEYEKALLYYEKLYSNNSRSNYYFQYYLNCLVKIEDYKKAEKIAKKAIKDNPTNLSLFINWAEVYSAQNDLVSAQKVYQKSIEQISRDISYNNISNLGNQFASIGQLDYALMTYEKGRKFYPTKPEFEYRIANVYGLKGDTDLMIESYLDLAVKYPNYLNMAKSQLSSRLKFDAEDFNGSEPLRIALLKRVQKHPEESVYNELMIWYFVQIKDFDAAFVQVKSFDKKQGAKGYLVLDFGRICFNNKAYSAAVRAYDYVIGLGQTGSFYQSAVVERLRSLNAKLIERNNYTQADLIKLKNDYLSTINFIGDSPMSVNLRLDLGKLLAFHLHDSDSAVRVFESALTIPGVQSKTKAWLKMALADVLTFKGDVWDASLYYSQVEKTFKEEPIGHEAKFRKARIFYYEGDFTLAQSQLDVLKTSTSKLIANDAFELSLLITDNLNLDTTQLNMKRFAKADLLIYQNRYNEAITILDSINASVAYHSLNDEILYKRYEIAFQKKDWHGAEAHLFDIVANYGEDILADNALFKLAELYHYQHEDKTKAADYYKQLLFNYSGSLFAVEARKRYRKLAEEL